MINSVSPYIKNWRTISDIPDIDPEDRVCDGRDRMHEKSVVIGAAALKEMWVMRVTPDHDAIFLHDAHVEEYESNGVAAFDRLGQADSTAMKIENFNRNRVLGL